MLTGSDLRTKLAGIEIELSISYLTFMFLMFPGFARTLELGKKLTGPLSSVILMYLSLQIKKPYFVSLKMCLTLQTGQIT